MFAVISDTESGQQCGIDSDGERQLDRNKIELMRLEEAQATAARFGGVVINERRLYPEDFQSEY